MATKKKTVVLGCVAKDFISGFKGTVVGYLDLLNGNRQCTLQPAMVRGKDEKPKMHSFDLHSLEFVEAGISAKAATITDYANVALGSKALDKASGYTGIVVERATFFNGCVQYGLQPKIDPNKKTELPEVIWFSSERITNLGPGITVPTLKTGDAHQKPPGGSAIEGRRIA